MQYDILSLDGLFKHTNFAIDQGKDIVDAYKGIAEMRSRYSESDSKERTDIKKYLKKLEVGFSKRFDEEFDSADIDHMQDLQKILEEEKSYSKPMFTKSMIEYYEGVVKLKTSNHDLDKQGTLTKRFFTQKEELSKIEAERDALKLARTDLEKTLDEERGKLDSYRNAMDTGLTGIYVALGHGCKQTANYEDAFRFAVKDMNDMLDRYSRDIKIKDKEIKELQKNLGEKEKERNAWQKRFWYWTALTGISIVSLFFISTTKYSVQHNDVINTPSPRPSITETARPTESDEELKRILDKGAAGQTLTPEELKKLENISK